MGKILNIYDENENGINVDKTWYNSSNIKYSECVDNNDDLKTLRIVFTNGTQYEYQGVEVQQYLLFREDASQGKALNRLIKSGNYKYTKLENADLKVIEDELFFIMQDGNYLRNTDKGFEIKNKSNEVIYHLNEKLDDKTYGIIKDILSLLSITFKEEK